MLMQFTSSIETNDFSLDELLPLYLYYICHKHSGSFHSSPSLPNGIVLND
jgi:hypothetical protein